MIHITQNMVESNQSNYEFWSLLISGLTGILTVIFAVKSYFLEKRIGKMSIFNGKTYVSKMEVAQTKEQCLRFMFVNHSNVSGVLDMIYIEIEPKSLLKRILYKIQSNFSEEPEKDSPSFYGKLLYKIYNFIEKKLMRVYGVTLLYDYILHKQSTSIEKKFPPFKVGPKDTFSIYLQYKTFIQDINKELKEHDARIKEIGFISSEGAKFPAKLCKKQFPGLLL